MCCTCDANRLLDEPGKTIVFDWQDGGASIEVQATGEGPEFKPAQYRFRRAGDNWSPWLPSNDLSESVSRLGTDVKWNYVRQEVKDYLLGKMSQAVFLKWLVQS